MDQQIVSTPRCGHGHGPLLDIPDQGLRCPACFPEIFIGEVERLRGLVARLAEVEPGDTNGSFDPSCVYCGGDCDGLSSDSGHAGDCPWAAARLMQKDRDAD